MSDSAAPEPPEIRSLWNYDDAVESEGRFRQVLSDFAGKADRAYLLQVETQLARALGRQKKFAEADQVLDAIEAQLGEVAPVVRVRYLLERGRVRNSSGEVEAARPLFKAALETAEACGEDAFALDAIHMLAIAHSGQEALDWNLRGIAIAEASTNTAARGWLGPLYNNTGWTLHDDFQQYERALELFEKGVQFRTEQKQAKETRIARWCVARALRSLKRVTEALAIQRDLEREWAEIKEEDGFVQEELAECLVALGQTEEARAHAQLAHEQLSQMDWFAKENSPRLERMAVIAAGTFP